MTKKIFMFFMLLNTVINFSAVEDVVKIDESGSGVTSGSGTGYISIGKGSKSKESIAIGSNSDASTTDNKNNGAIAVGTDSKSTFSSISIGKSSISGSSSIAIGESSKAIFSRSLSIGKESLSYVGGISIGDKTKSGNNAISLGIEAISGNGEWSREDKGKSGSESIAIGYRANTNFGEKAISIGSNSSSKNKSVSIGSDTKSEGSSSITIGDSAVTKMNNSIAIGMTSKVEARQATAVGAKSYIDSDSRFAVALGAKTSINKANQGIAIGNFAYVGDEKENGQGSEGYLIIKPSFKEDTKPSSKNQQEHYNSMAIGSYSASLGYQSMAIGTGARAYNANTVALGKLSIAKGDYSVALGPNAKTLEERAVSIGRNAIARTKRSSAIGLLADAMIEDSVALGSYSLANVEKGNIGYDPKTKEIFKLEEIEGFNRERYEELGTKITEDEKTLKTKLEEYKSSEDEAVKENLKTEIIKLEEDLGNNKKEKNKMVSVWESTAGAVSIGNTEMGITRQIIGVSAGTEDTHAVNIAQLKRLEEKINNNISSNVNEINILKGEVLEANSGVSNAIAIASLTPLNQGKKHNISLSYGSYSGYHSMALGLNGKLNMLDYKLNGSLNNKGHFGIGLGLGYSFGDTTVIEEDVNKDVRIKKLEEEVKILKELIMKIEKKIK